MNIAPEAPRALKHPSFAWFCLFLGGLFADPSLVHPERYNKDMVTANPSPGTWSAYPNPSSITLYKDGQGYPKFDLAKAKTYFAKVNEKLTRLIQETIRKWDLAGL